MVAPALCEFSKQPRLEVIKATIAAVDELKFPAGGVQPS